jgi:hypothetical protein
MRSLSIMLAVTALAGGLAPLATPAVAQQSTTAEVVVYGNDPCPRSTDDQVVVCSRRPETERYRLPKNQQLQGTRQQRQSWAKKSQQLMTVGNTGVGSCSAVGPGGREGCLTQQIQQEKQAAREAQQDNTPPQL